VRLGAAGHLSYCSNIHPGETWDEVQANLRRHLPAVRRRLGVAGDFGIGLRLSAQAAEALARPQALAAFQAFLADEGFYVFTLNGFPYGTFHGTRVKEGVYLPDWRSPERLRYTNQLADLLAALLPAEPGLEGSVSTVPGAYKPALDGPDDAAHMAAQLVAHVAHLVGLHQRCGRTITLALEPEPNCFLETVAESVAFFEQHLFGPEAVAALAAHTGLAPDAALHALQRHLGLCLDLCHAAVEYENPAEALQQLQQAGIRVHKLQISAGLRLPELTPPALAALQRFDDPVYLHQVIARRGGALQRFADLPEALATVDSAVGDHDSEWRVHFHVPIFLEHLGAFGSTQGFIREVLAQHRQHPLTQHLEVETYTWDVLPPAWRSGSVDEAIARELAWVREVLQA
jgi:sugar phosphate isomerase/epimerase